MGLNELINTERVLYSQTGIYTDVETGIQVTTPLGVGAAINLTLSTVDVSVLECDLTPTSGPPYTGAVITLNVKKHVVFDLLGDVFQDYTFNKSFPVVFGKLAHADITSADLARAHCFVRNIKATDSLGGLVIPIPPALPTFAETLVVTFDVGLAVDDQLIVALCSGGMKTRATLSILL